MYKITGNTGKGKAGCGCVVRARIPYFIQYKGKDLISLCAKCAGKRKSYKTIKTPQDLQDGCIPIN